MTDPLHISGTSDRSVIFVHGRNFKPAAAEYMDILCSALTSGIAADYPESVDALMSLNRYLAYYGDLTNAFLTAEGEVYDEQLDITDRRNALHRLKGIDRKKGFGVSRYDKLPGKSSLTEFAATVLSPVLSAVGLEKKFLAGRHKDLGEYWNSDSELGATVLERVRSTICAALDRDERILLVSHGTGAIVTFDALWQLSHDPAYTGKYGDAKIDIWLTLGCPLGDATVQRNLLGADRKGRERYPTNILSWHNVSAEDDFVSHDNTVADDFKTMLKLRQISSIRDYRIYNLAIRYGRANPHSSIGYLVHPRVARIVTDWLTQSFGSPLPKSIL